MSASFIYGILWAGFVLLLGPCLLVGLWLFVRGRRGRLMLSEPHCAKCRYDLRGHLLQDHQSRICPECGSDLSAPGAVDFGRGVRRPRVIVAGVIVALLPAVLLAGSMLAWQRRVVQFAGPMGNAAKTNAQLLTDLKTTADQPWTWRELESRYKSGRLTDAEVATSVDELIASIAKFRKTHGYSGPLHWSDTFLKAVEPSISDPQRKRLYSTYYGSEGEIVARSKLRAGRELLARVRWQAPWGLPGSKFVKALREVRQADGKKLAVRPQYENVPDPDQRSADGSQDIDVRIALGLPPGEHELTFILDAGALPERSEFTAINGRPGQKNRWLNPIQTWEAVVKHKLTLVPADQEIIEKVTDPKLDPVAAGAIRPPRIFIRKARQGVSVESRWDSNATPPVDIVMAVTIRIDGKDRPAGAYYRTSRGSGYGGSFSLDSLPPEISSADIILRPDLTRAENETDAERLWGKDIIFEAVPLERYDLPTTTTAGG